jgi:hypothetical protein
MGITKYARQHHIEFAWQARYHDRIVRDDADCQRIREYIVGNPQNGSPTHFMHNGEGEPCKPPHS